MALVDVGMKFFVGYRLVGGYIGENFVEVAGKRVQRYPMGHESIFCDVTAGYGTTT